jgi:cephalosporin hydroxylase
VNPIEKFQQERQERVGRLAEDIDMNRDSQKWVYESMRRMYVYNFDWLGRPIIQYPQDMVAMQELIWITKPDLIIETGIAHGGSLMLSASMLALLDMCDAIELKKKIDPMHSKRKVLGIDIDIRSHNRAAIESHPMASRIQMIEGSSISTDVISKVRDIASHFNRVLVCLDSNHTYDHVLAELNAYAPLVSADSYCIVFDTFVEDMPADLFPDRSWGPGNNPKTAVFDYLKGNSDFIVDQEIQNKLLITVAPHGYLRRVG